MALELERAQARAPRSRGAPQNTRESAWLAPAPAGGRRAGCACGSAAAARAGAPSARSRARCRRRRRAPRGRGTRRGSSVSTRLAVARERLRVLDARRRSRRAYASSPPCATTQITCPVVTGSPGRDRQPRRRRRRGARTISFSIFIASTMQITCPAVDRVALRDPDRQHRALHRADDRVARRAAAPPRRRARSRRRRASSAHGGSGTSTRDLEAAAVELDGGDALAQRGRRCAAGTVARVSSCRGLLAPAAPTRRSRGTSRPRRSTGARAARGGSRAASARRRSRTRRARAASAGARARGRRPRTISFAIIGS